MTVPYAGSFPTEVFTAAAWIKLPTPVSRSAIIARGEDDNSFNLSWQLFVSGDGTLQIMLEDAMENNFCYPSTCMGQPQPSCSADDIFVADDTWHHVAATRNAAGTLILYVDGLARTTCTATGVPSSNNFQSLTIGCTYGSIGPLPPGQSEPPIWFFAGLIDEPAMWSTALTGPQIESVASVGPASIPAGLVGYWDLDEGIGQAVADASLAGNDGFLGAGSTADSADPVWVLGGPTLPAPPSALAAAATSVSTIQLMWNDNSTNEEGFAIDRRPSGGAFARIANLPAGSVAFTDAGLPAASTFEYRVAAVNGFGESAFSNLAGATTFAPSECVGDAETLCLQQERFQVEVGWRDFEDATGAGRVVVGSQDSGLFWFFDDSNWEMMVKVLDGCGFNDRFWVFASATTNVEFTLRVTDTETGVTREYLNPLGTSATAITDTEAFAACP